MLPLCHALAVAVLQVFIFSENWAFAKNINFYNVRPPLDPTPFPNSFKCFTCENAGDNYNCNRWAEDKWCPQNTQYCLTVHHFTSHGRSTSITKKCASRSECHFVGCHHSRDSEHTRQTVDLRLWVNCPKAALKAQKQTIHERMTDYRAHLYLFMARNHQEHCTGMLERGKW
ncbi:ly6/PLAUR domain-containing protein 6B isoform X1 [Talpa occidentalis]|uniref:ly6/PLAUR domain-containing protein 6B isoform X1 n=1 Tax=Talpa occidentalis TaxID=50954 RepID=UPI00188E72BF|nr:ly6/PLAUR domain-containing protein 6B isoform X1 [Talpa occidentalis]